MPSPRVNWIISATDKVSATVKDIDGRLGKLGNTFRTIGTVAIGAAAVRGLTQLARSTLEWGDRLDDLSQRTGIAQDTLQGFEYAAAQTGATLESVSKAIVKLARSGDDANRGLLEYAEAFERLGINAEELVKLPLEEQFFKVADAVAGLSSESEQLALGQRVLGRGFAELLPSIKDGSGALRQYFEEARRLGGLTANQIQALGDANDAFTSLGTAIANIGRRGFASVARNLEALANAFTGVITRSAAFRGEAGLLNAIFTRIGAGAYVFAEGIDAVGESLGAVTAALVQVAQGNFAEAARIIDDYAERSADRVQEIGRNIQSILSGDVEAGTIKPPDIGDVLDAFGDVGAESDKLRKQLEKDAQRIFDSTRTPLEKYAEGIEKVQELLAGGFINADTAARGIAKLGTELGEATQAFVDSTEAGRRWKQAIEDIADITEETKTPLERLQDELKRIAELRAPPLPEIVTDGTEGQSAFAYSAAADEIEAGLAKIGALEAPTLPAIRAGDVDSGVVREYADIRRAVGAELLRIEALDAPTLPAIEASGTEALVVQQYGAAIDRAVDQVGRQLDRIASIPAPQLPPVEGEIAGDIVLEYAAIADGIQQQQERIGNLPPTQLPPLQVERGQIAAVLRFLDSFDVAEEKYNDLAKTLARLGQLEAAGVLDADIAADARRRAFDEVIAKGDEVVSAYEEMERKYIELQKLFDQGLISGVTLERGKIEAQRDYIKDLETQADATTGKVTEILEQIRNATDGVARDITAAFFDSTKSIGDAFEDMLDRIAQSIIEKNVIQLIIDSITGAISGASASGGGGISGFFKSLFGRAEGGPVSRGTPYLVGEEGPELFIPQQSGRIAASGAGTSLNITFNVNSLDPNNAAAVIAGNERVITNVVRRAMVRAGNRPTL